MGNDTPHFLSTFRDPNGGGWMTRRGQSVYVPGPLRVAVPVGELRNMLPTSSRGRFDNIVLDTRHSTGSKDQEFLNRLKLAAQDDEAFLPLVNRMLEALR